MGASTMNGQPPPLPPGFVLDAQPQARPAQRQSAGAPPPLPPGFVLDGQDQGESWSPNDAPRAQTVDPRSIPTKGAIEPYDPSMAEIVGDRLYDSARAAGLPASRMRRDAAGLDAFVRGTADTATFGFADEIAAKAADITGIGGRQGDYDANLEYQRAVDERDRQLNPVARMGGQVAGGVLNATGVLKSGLSLAGNAAKGGWLTRLMMGSPVAGRAVGGAVDGAVQAGGYGFGSGEDGVARRLRAGADLMPLGALFGSLAEGVAGVSGKGWNAFAKGANDAAPGVDPAAAVAQAQEFGIPVSRAQATQSVKQAGIEDQLRHSGNMQAFDAAQREAVDQSVGNFQQRLAGSNRPIPSQASAYDNVPEALRGVRDRTKAGARTGYDDSVNNPNVLVDGKAVADLPAFIQRNLDADQIVIDPMYHQGASRALEFIQDYIGRMPQVGKDGVQGVQAQLRWIENLRASLGKNFPPLAQDAPALKAIKGAIDDWTDEIFDKGMVSASDEVLDALKQGRAKWTEYMAMTEPRTKIGGRLNPQYEAQATVRRLMDKNLSPEEIGLHLWGTSVAAPKMNSLMTAQLLRRQLGPDSPEWNGIRQSFWLRATRAGDETMSPAKIGKNLDGLLNGQGASVAKVLFSETEREAMKSFAGVMKMLQPNKAGINNSNTANRILPQLQRYAGLIMGSLAGGGSFAGGLEPMLAVSLGMGATAIPRGAGAFSRASRASTATTMPVPALPSGRGGATLRGGAIPTAEEINRRLQPDPLALPWQVRR